ncbi:biotin--[acetyl-CoA-carboxylase] ligase [Aliihoeflea aestuarii]|jgi:BirA family transcriptional regulator, biotin operon repressor / biotin---[acetyl-CoA-carboxylase] ligase|uniref:biotin--[acetyl-CoA-carboxylase] ligase n=1 Tax=Aliihoeflea aestuarii TaxID=453840 RepID=UPI0020928DA0|nr:biotin--[acetyl-CoA-carboxylase] ligase [Aliihoeflea aestuarii]MCO6390743.1 biotin--[acetyl-CoA-carboxylase] ligase [Aliihoeflea aestuarii]
MAGFSLAPSAIAAGYQLEIFDTVGSTNIEALDAARAGGKGRVWFVSDHQVSGRGRRGRPWQTQRGNLAASLLLVPDVPLKDAAALGFVAGLSLADALDAAIPDAQIGVGIDGGSVAGKGRFELKWPNDVLAHGAKLSGILLESKMLDAGRYALVIGIGVNVVTEPQDVPYPATSLAKMGAKIDARQLFLALSDAWIDNERLWRDGRGLGAIREKWLSRAAGLGSEVAVNVEGRIARGTFETIDEECRFVIRENDGSTIRIAAGDVHFGAVASVPQGEKAGV